MSCNAENAADHIPPLDFNEVNDLVKTSLARRGLSDALPTDSSFGQGQGQGRGNGRGGRGGRLDDRGNRALGNRTRPQVKINGKALCYTWNNNRPCNGTPTLVARVPQERRDCTNVVGLTMVRPVVKTTENENMSFKP